MEDETKMPDEFVLRAHDILIGFNMPEAKLTAHEDSVLDFLDDRFLFVSKEIAKFLD